MTETHQYKVVSAIVTRRGEVVVEGAGEGARQPVEVVLRPLPHVAHGVVEAQVVRRVQVDGGGRPVLQVQVRLDLLLVDDVGRPALTLRRLWDK